VRLPPAPMLATRLSAGSLSLATPPPWRRLPVSFYPLEPLQCQVDLSNSPGPLRALLAGAFARELEGRSTACRSQKWPSEMGRSRGADRFGLLSHYRSSGAIKWPSCDLELVSLHRGPQKGKRGSVTPYLGPPIMLLVGLSFRTPKTSPNK